MDRYFYILGLEPGASLDQVRAAHRAMIQMCHPDRYAQNTKLRDEAESQSVKLNEAFQALKGFFDDSSRRPEPNAGRTNPHPSSGPTSNGSGSGGGSSTSSPFRLGPVRHPSADAHYVIKGRRVSFQMDCWTSKVTDLHPTNGLPKWEDISKLAERMNAGLHVAGDDLYRMPMDPGDIMILKHRNLDNNDSGFMVLFRKFDKTLWHTTNDPKKNWKRYTKGAVCESWGIGDGGLLFLLYNITDEKSVDVLYQFDSNPDPGAPRAEQGASSNGLFRGSDVAGPVFTEGDYYNPVGQKVRLLFKQTTGAGISSTFGKVFRGVGGFFNNATDQFPPWSDISSFGAKIDGGSLHSIGDPYYFALLEPDSLVYLKYDGQKTFGYMVVYRDARGEYHYKTNETEQPWKPLPIGSPVSTRWFTENRKARIVIDLLRPNTNQDSKGREVDYRFRLEII